MASAGLFISQRTGRHSAGISYTSHELLCPYVVLCDSWSETSVALSQLTQVWQIPRHRTLSYPLSSCFITVAPLTVKPASTPWRLLPKQTWKDSVPTDILLSAVSVLVVALLSSEFLEGLMNYPIYIRLINEVLSLRLTLRF
jgi:hypothetical protein